MLSVHRPIFESGTATRARITARLPEREDLIGHELTAQTAEYLRFTKRTDNVVVQGGVITSYNVNTFRGRVYVPAEGRPIPFELSDTARGEAEIAESLQRFATDQQGPRVEVSFRCSELRSRSD